MNYHELVERLYASMSFSYSNGLSSEKRNSLVISCLLNQKLGNPAQNHPFVHVAGTNGKGSVVFKIARSCFIAGFKVGVFTSPHLDSIRERIQINEEKISEEDFTRCGEKVFSTIKEIPYQVNFFEILTAIALEYFAMKHVDLVIFETGIGGRFDSTNFITPILSIITSISPDHIPFLGVTLEEIAWQKAGIIKKGVPVVLGPTAQMPVIIKEAELKESPILLESDRGLFFDEENSNIARRALRYIAKHFLLSEEAIALGVKERPSCRFEVISFSAIEGFERKPEHVILDVAHNLDGFRKLIEAIRANLEDRPLRFVIGMSKEKEVKECLQLLSLSASFIHLASIDHFKLFKAERLREELLLMGYTNCGFEETLHNTLRVAMQEAADKREHLIVCGSFYIMTHIRRLLDFSK